ncbi:hypothetical protein [Lysinibacter cavernae]|uniref:hypothetical protein n=1 Tax=Lysinibacter cavernae TaxID=1640652 RepID=UPI0036103D5A
MTSSDPRTPTAGDTVTVTHIPPRTSEEVILTGTLQKKEFSGDSLFIENIYVFNASSGAYNDRIISIQFQDEVANA